MYSGSFPNRLPISRVARSVAGRVGTPALVCVLAGCSGQPASSPPSADGPFSFPNGADAAHVLWDCPALNVFVSYERAERDGLSIGAAQPVWRYAPAPLVGWRLSATDEWLAAIRTGDTVDSTAQLVVSRDDPPYCMSNWEPDVAERLGDFEPGDKLVSVMLHPAYGDQYYRQHDGTMIPLNAGAIEAIHGTQPYSAFRTIITTLAACFPDDCGDASMPTPIAAVAPPAERTATPSPTDDPSSVLTLFAVRAVDEGPQLRIDGRERTSSGRFITVDVAFVNNSLVTVTLTAPPTIETADGASHAPLAGSAAAEGPDSVPGSRATGPECTLAPIGAGAKRTCTLLYDLPDGARDPYLVQTWGEGRAAGATRIQLRMGSDGYPGP